MTIKHAPRVTFSTARFKEMIKEAKHDAVLRGYPHRVELVGKKAVLVHPDGTVEDLPASVGEGQP